jgi:peptidyl-prolyl cis-trans isomerase SurA
MDRPQFREELRNQLLLHAPARARAGAACAVSELDIDQFLREQTGTTPAPEMNLAHILVAVPENATDARWPRAGAGAAAAGAARAPARTSPSWRARTPTAAGAAPTAA